MVFSYHSGEQALIFPGPKGQPIGIKVADLQAAGWTVTAEGLRAVLPRADVSSLLQAGGAADIAAAAAAARSRAQLDRGLKGR